MSTQRRRKAKIEEPKRPVGRPTDFNKELADAICTEIMKGCSLRSICARDDMPGQTSVFKWLLNNEEFVKNYESAMKVRADLLFEDCLDIADDASGDFVETELIDGVTICRPDHEHIQRSRLRVDTRKWMIGKMAPKKYGEKITQEISGPDGAALAPTIILSGGPQSSPPPKTVGRVRNKGN